VATGGLVLSGFSAWLDDRREKGEYLDYMEFQAPADRYGDAST
jgi:hypothetical protein